MNEHAIETQILSLAARIAADEAEARHWYRSDTITGLDSRTAHELVQAGRGPAVLDFLQGILRCEGPTRLR
jgi:hypothetical protein